MLTGCAQDLMFQRCESRHGGSARAKRLRSGHAAGAKLLRLASRAQRRMGNGAGLARKKIDQFPPEQFDAIITNAAGCGSHLKHYANLLADDPVVSKSARTCGMTKVKDIHEWLAQIGIQPPANKNLRRKT